MSDEPKNHGDETQTGSHRVLPAGTVLADRYEVEELVGMGGMGMVYRARDRRLDVEVAIKILNEDLAAERETLERFERELVLARQVSHANVVRIHDIAQDGELHFLTMDYVAGRSLKAVLEEEGAMGVARAAEVGRDLAAALGAAHDRGVVHRDLKPANVLIDDGGRAFITDFGVARSLTGRGPTRTGHVLGTPDYLSPEQALGKEVDARSDIYALGLVLYEMVSGALPFSADSLDESLAQRVAGKPRALNSVASGVPAWMDEIIHRCLQRDPDDRYPDAQTLRRDLESHCAPPVRRSGTRWLAVAGFSLLAAGLVAGWLYFPGQPGTPKGSSRPVAAPVDPASRSLAVVPFADETGKDPLAWVSTGVAEMVAVDLAQAPSLEVVDSLRVFRTARDLGLDPGVLAASEGRQLGELLDAEYLVMGRVRSTGNGLQLDARLAGLDPGEDEIQRFSRTVKDAGSLLDAAGSLAGEIRDYLAADPAQGAESVLSASPEAMAAYGRGVSLLTEGDTLAAVEPLLAATRADDSFAAAWVRLAEARQSLGYRDDAIVAAQRAVEELENPEGRIALEARALQAELKGDTERAISLRERLVDRFPNDIEARVRLGELQGDSGQLDAARKTLTDVVEQDASHPRAWYLLGKFSILAGESREAIDEYLVRALVIQNRLDNPQGRADVMNAMGIAYSQVGELEQAQQQYAQAAEIRRSIGDRRGVAATLSNLARIQAMRGKYEAASEGLAEALSIQRDLGDRYGVAYLHNERGILEEEQGHYEAALGHYRDALRVRRELGDSRATAESLINIGYMYLLLGEYDNTGVYTRQALDLYREDGNREGVMLARETLAQLETARGDWDAALDAALAALEASREIGNPGTQAVSLGVIGQVALYQGRYRAALDSLQEALGIVRELGDPRGIAEYELARAELLLELGAAQPASEALDLASEHLADGGNREQRAELLRLRGEAALQAGEIDTAIARLVEAEQEAEGSNSITALLNARLALGRSRLAGNETGAARELLEGVATRAGELGHAALQLEALESRARAENAAGDSEAAMATLNRALELASTHAPWGRKWRLHFLRARLPQSGESEQDRSAALAALARVRENLPDEHEAAFNALPEVSELDGHESTAR